MVLKVSEIPIGMGIREEVEHVDCSSSDVDHTMHVEKEPTFRLQPLLNH